MKFSDKRFNSLRSSFSLSYVPLYEVEKKELFSFPFWHIASQTSSISSLLDFIVFNRWMQRMETTERKLNRMTKQRKQIFSLFMKVRVFFSAAQDRWNENYTIFSIEYFEKKQIPCANACISNNRSLACNMQIRKGTE